MRGAGRLGRRRVGGAVVAVAVGALAAACAQIPTSGPVMESQAEAATSKQLYFNPLPPRDDATPDRIVEGFLAAQNAGPVQSFDVAKAYLTGDATAWSPYTQVYVYSGDPGLEVVESSEEEGRATVTGQVDVVGTIDENGVYTEEPADAVRDLSFGLVQDDRGRWRIDQTEDGLLVSVSNFDQSFQDSILYFPSPDRDVFVPDERWFPKNASWQTYVVNAILEGPSPWLGGAVVNVAPSGSKLAISSVPVEDGVATVDLSGPVTSSSPEDRALLQEQIEASLVGSDPRTLGGDPIRSVELTANGAPLVPSSDSSDTPDLVVPSDDAVAISRGALVSVDGSTLKAIEGAPSLDGLDVTGFALDGDLAAHADGASVLVVDSGERLVRLRTDEPASTEMLLGEGVLTPSVDRLGWAWTGDATGRIVVIGEDAGRKDVDVPWLAGRTPLSIDLAPDGARAVITSAGPGGVQVDVTGVLRGKDGAPESLTEPFRIGPQQDTVIDARWTSPTAVAVLGRFPKEDADAVRVYPVGGRSTTLAVVSDARSIAAADGVRSLLVVDGDGGLSGRSSSGTTWLPLATKVDLVAYPR